MLRLVFILLLLANGVVLAWSQGALQSVLGFGAASQREPQRMAQQLHPERLVLLLKPSPSPSNAAGAKPADAASPAGPPPQAPLPQQDPRPDASAAEPAASGESAPAGRGTSPSAEATAPVGTSTAPAAAAAAPAITAQAPTQCLQAGLFTDAQAATLRERAADVLPPGRWSLVAATGGGRWMVYMGRYPDAQSLEKKRAELRARQVDFAPPSDAALQPGLSLGVFSTQQAAETALADLAQQHGVRTARVVQQRPAQTGYWLRLPAVDAALKPALAALAPALVGHALAPCE